MSWTEPRLGIVTRPASAKKILFLGKKSFHRSLHYIGRASMNRHIGQGVEKLLAVAALDDPVIKNHKNLSIIKASILELTDTEIAQHVKGCSAVASCLGHNMNCKGIYGHPLRLVMDATRRLCNAIKVNQPSTCPMESPKLTIQ